MDKKNFVFGKENFIILAVSVVIIILGFWLMSGAKSTEETGFNPQIFSTRRIVIAPIVTMIGFALVVLAILKKPNDSAIPKEIKNGAVKK
jgi:uncharacterized membrane protein